MTKPTIYDLLAKQGIDEITQSQLNTATSNSDVDEASIGFWKGPITLQRVLEMRTYPHALPIPELGTIQNSPPFSESAHDFQPTGTEIWNIMGIQVVADGGTDAAVVLLKDADGSSCILHSANTSTSAQSFFPWESPLAITRSLYLSIENAGTNNFTCAVAYQKVGL